MKLKSRPKNIAVHTPTEEEAKELLAILHENGYEWCGGYSLLKEDTEWNVSKDKTCYYISSYVEYDSIQEANAYKALVMSLAEFKEKYCEEEKAPPKFKVGDIVKVTNPSNWAPYRNAVGKVVGLYVDQTVSVRFPNATSSLFVWDELSRLEPCAESEAKDEAKGAKEKAEELNLCKLLKRYEGEVFYSLLYGRTQLRRVGEDCLEIATINGKYWTSIEGDGIYADGGEVVLFPSRALYEQYPLDPCKAWSEWQQKQKKIALDVNFRTYDAPDFGEVLYFRTHSDRDKCIEEIKAIIEKYNKE